MMFRALPWILLVACAVPAHAGIARRAVEVAGRRRTYWLYVPASVAAVGGHASPDAPQRGGSPLLIALHGHAGNGRKMRRVTGLDALADRVGAVIAYPDGTGWRGLPPRSWNAGNCCGYAQATKVDDLAFLRALIDDAASAVPLDRARVYVAGVSNGAMLAHRAGCELPGLAGIVSVAGTRSVEACAPSRPVPVLSIHGTADGYVPYHGGRGSQRRDERVDLAVGEATAQWARANGCGAARDEALSPGVTRTVYDCPPGAGVALITIEDGGHAWPGGERAWRFGDAPPPVPANDLLWDFFEAQRR